MDMMTTTASETVVSIRLSPEGFEVLKQIINEHSYSEFSIEILSASHRIGTKRHEVIVNLAITFAVGVGSSLAATGLISLFSSTPVQPVGNSITINDSVIVINTLESANSIEKALAARINHSKKNVTRPTNNAIRKK